MTRFLLAAAVTVLVVATPRAQAPSAEPKPVVFDVASIKANKSGDGRVLMQNQAGGRSTRRRAPSMCS